jgi:hypothetical protein
MTNFIKVLIATAAQLVQNLRYPRGATLRERVDEYVARPS